MTGPGVLLIIQVLYAFARKMEKDMTRDFSLCSVNENNYLFALCLWFHKEHGNLNL
jgi:hypothetical protein